MDESFSLFNDISAMLAEALAELRSINAHLARIIRLSPTFPNDQQENGNG
jgi:hypothetical protein